MSKSKVLRTRYERGHFIPCETKKGRFTKRYTLWLENELERLNQVENDGVLGDVIKCDACNKDYEPSLCDSCIDKLVKGTF